MRIFIIIFSLLITTNCFAKTILYRYTDKITGDERGLCYSDNDGESIVRNPEWNGEVIPESEQSKYIKLHEKQIKEKNEAVKTDKNNKIKSVKSKLKALGLTDGELDAIIPST